MERAAALVIRAFTLQLQSFALKAQLDNLEDFLDHGMDPTVDTAAPFLEEQNCIGRIIDRIEAVKLSQ